MVFWTFNYHRFHYNAPDLLIVFNITIFFITTLFLDSVICFKRSSLAWYMPLSLFFIINHDFMVKFPPPPSILFKVHFFKDLIEWHILLSYNDFFFTVIYFLVRIPEIFVFSCWVSFSSCLQITFQCFCSVLAIHTISEFIFALFFLHCSIHSPHFFCFCVLILSIYYVKFVNIYSNIIP